MSGQATGTPTPLPAAPVTGSVAPAPEPAPTPATPPATPPADPVGDPLKANIASLIEKARAEEKSKLYSQIQRAEADAAAAKAQLTETQAQTKALADAVAQLKAAGGQPPKPEGTPAPAQGMTADQQQALLTAAVAAALDKANNTMFKPQISALAKELENAKAELAKRDLESYKNELISKNAETIIPDLVSGNSREELDTSLVKAKQVFAIVAKQITDKAAGGGQPLPGVPPITNGTQSITPAGAAGNLNSVSGLSDAEYAKQRDELLRQTVLAFQGAMRTA